MTCFVVEKLLEKPDPEAGCWMPLVAARFKHEAYEKATRLAELTGDRKKYRVKEYVRVEK